MHKSLADCFFWQSSIFRGHGILERGLYHDSSQQRELLFSFFFFFLGGGLNSACFYRSIIRGHRQNTTWNTVRAFTWRKCRAATRSSRRRMRRFHDYEKKAGVSSRKKSFGKHLSAPPSPPQNPRHRRRISVPVFVRCAKINIEI